jgi:hypothetical protein
MKEIRLTQGRVALVDDEDYEYLNQWNWCLIEKKDKNLFYAARKVKNRRLILMHRVILGLTDPNIFGDHVDRNGLNNQRNNLRVATHSQNCTNVKKYKNASSKYKGVSWHKASKKWVAQIQKDKKVLYLGGFEKEIDAAIAYNNATNSIHGEFANPNKIAV